MVSGNILAQAILQGVMIGAVYGLICLGLNMLFAVTGLLNFAHGNFLALAMYICLSLYTSFQLDPYLSMLITIPIFFGLGYLLFKFLFKKVLNVHILMGVQLSLGLLFVIESSLLLVYGADYQSVPSFLGTTVLRVGELSISAPFIVAFVVAIIIAIVLFRILGTTRLGRSIRAIVQNREAATLMGINVGKLQTIVFAIGIALLGLCGPLITDIRTMLPSMGLEITLLAFIIMIIGGMGNFIGSIIGGFIIGVIEMLSHLFLGGSMASLVPYAVFVIILLVKPYGLFGEKYD